jgi:hypothetical protein
MSDSSATDFERLMASIGSLMFHWCLLEDSLTDEVRRLRIESEGDASLIRIRGSFNDRLREWRGLLSQKTRRKPELAEAVAALANEMEQLRHKRNLIAHDLAGASAEPDEEPHIRCSPRERSSLSSEVTRITLAELIEATEAIDRCRDRLRTDLNI